MAERQRGNPIGPVGITVALNLKRARKARDMTQEDVSRYLAMLGRYIPTASIGKIEAGSRAVEVDDLIALAIAVDVSPLALLLPVSDDETEGLKLGSSTIEGGLLWDWALGQQPMWKDPLPSEALTYFTTTVPPWLEGERREAMVRFTMKDILERHGERDEPLPSRRSAFRNSADDMSPATDG